MELTLNDRANPDLHPQDKNKSSACKIVNWQRTNTLQSGVRNPLRALDGTGHLKVSSDSFLPFNVNGFDNQPSSSPAFFLAGDVRVNENSPPYRIADHFHAGA